jgi:excisionase family DNA binding protein
MNSVTQSGLPRLVSLRDASKELGMSVWTLRDLVASGTLRAVQPPGVRRILLDRKDLERAIESWKS